MVVLAPHPRRVPDVGQRQQPEQLGPEVGPRREPLPQPGQGVGGHERILVGRAGDRTVVHRALAEALHGHVAQRLGDRPVEHAVVDPEATGGGHPADHRGPDLPPLAEGQDLVEVLRRHDGQHPFLALGDHDLHRVHPWLPAQHAGDVDVHPHAALGRRLRRGAGQPAGAEVLHADGQTGVEEGQAGLDELLLLERVADLDRRALVGRRFVEPGRGQDAGAADAVAPGGGTEQHGKVAFALGPGQHETAFRQDAEAENVHQGISAVAGVEDDLTAHGRHADRIAIAGDPGDHPFNQITVAGAVEGAETQRVHEPWCGSPAEG